MEQISLNFTLSLSPEEMAVLDLLREGRECAISSAEIEKRTGINQRRIQQIVRTLRLKHGYSVGSNTARPVGYYLTREQNENADMAKKLRKRGLKILMLAAQFSRDSLDMVFNQARIEMERESSQK